MNKPKKPIEQNIIQMVEISKDEKERVAGLAAITFIVIMLGCLGIVYIQEIFSSFVTCAPGYPCMLIDFGSLLLSGFSIGMLLILVYWIFYYTVPKYHQVEVKK
jgi:uncharacterized membrane protein